MQTGYSLLSEEMKREIKRVEKSVIGINASVIYEIETYDYAIRDGKPIPEKSRLGYRLKPDGVIKSRDEKALSGGGIIFYLLRINV